MGEVDAEEGAGVRRRGAGADDALPEAAPDDALPDEVERVEGERGSRPGCQTYGAGNQIAPPTLIHSPRCFGSSTRRNMGVVLLSNFH